MQQIDLETRAETQRKGNMQYDPMKDRAMWEAVIVQAHKDLSLRPVVLVRGGRVFIAPEWDDLGDAVAWFHQAGEEFQSVCSLADKQPHRVRAAALETMGREASFHTEAAVDHAATAELMEPGLERDAERQRAALHAAIARRMRGHHG